MQGSNLGFQTWALAFYLLTTGIKGTSSMKLHRDLGITQKSAWHLAHRIRETWADNTPSFSGPVEVDETYMGGKEKKQPGAARQQEDQRCTGDTRQDGGGWHEGSGNQHGSGGRN